MSTSGSNIALVTGASAGIGAVYADRLARRGHDLVLAARNTERLSAVAERIRGETGVKVEILPADLTRPDGLEAVESRLRNDAGIGLLVNNAGTALSGGFLDQSIGGIETLIGLNVTAVTRLARVAGERFAAAGNGAIVNVSSVLGFAPEIGMTVYGATKAFVLYLSQGMHLELGPKGVYVQAVLPSATRTEIWDHAGRDVDSLPAVMEVGELVDAALVGFDRRETITIPPLQQGEQWDAYDAARLAMVPNLLQRHAAPRYRAG